jgi:molybdopterin converting factor small subunit
MATMEQLELDAHRGQVVADVKALVERYRSIFEWDVPGIDQVRSDRLILRAIRDALDGVEKTLADEDAP